jgi:hypothetical protein
LIFGDGWALMRWLYGAAAMVMLVGGCAERTGADPVAAPDPVTSAPAPSAFPRSSNSPVWKSVAGGCPTLTGIKRVVDGPLGAANGEDDASSYQITCIYGDPGTIAGDVAVDIDIDREHPVADWSTKQLTARSAVAYANNLLVPLSGVGDGGFVVAQPGAGARTTVLAATSSGNAWIEAHIPVAQPISTEADLTAQAGRITPLLDDVLDDLRH